MNGMSLKQPFSILCILVCCWLTLGRVATRNSAWIIRQKQPFFVNNNMTYDKLYSNKEPIAPSRGIKPLSRPSQSPGIGLDWTHRELSQTSTRQEPGATKKWTLTHCGQEWRKPIVRLILNNFRSWFLAFLGKLNRLEEEVTKLVLDHTSVKTTQEVSRWHISPQQTGYLTLLT